jgi:hypothetical protein
MCLVLNSHRPLDQNSWVLPDYFCISFERCEMRSLYSGAKRAGESHILRQNWKSNLCFSKECNLRAIVIA